MWRRSIDPSRLKEAFERVPLDSPICDGVPLEFTITGGAGYYQQAHGLGRTPTDATLSGSSNTATAAGVFGNATYPADNRYMYFYATGNAVFRFWVW